MYTEKLMTGLLFLFFDYAQNIRLTFLAELHRWLQAMSEQSESNGGSLLMIFEPLRYHWDDVVLVVT